jgi:hypothetical protein
MKTFKACYWPIYSLVICSVALPQLPFFSPEPGGTTKVQPSSLPSRLPRIRRGLYLPFSINSQAGGFCTSAS